MGQWDKICSIISRVCGAKANLFSITKLFVRLFVRDNVCSHAEAQRAQSSHRELLFHTESTESTEIYYFPLIMFILSRRNGGNHGYLILKVIGARIFL